MSAGSYGVWAMRAGDFRAREFDGTPAGIASACAYAAPNGVVQVFLDGGLATLPTIPPGVQVIRVDQNRWRRFTAGGEAIPGHHLNLAEFATFQDAINALPAGGTLLCPPSQTGTYSQLSYPTFLGAVIDKPCYIVGIGIAAFHYHAVGSENVHSFDIRSGGVTLRNLSIIGRGWGTGAGSGNLIHWYAPGQDLQVLRVEDCYLLDAPQWGLRATCDSGRFFDKLDCRNVQFGSSQAGGAQGGVGSGSGDMFLGGGANTGGNNVRLVDMRFQGPGFGTFAGGERIGVVHLDQCSVIRLRGCEWQSPDDAPCMTFADYCRSIWIQDAYMEHVQGAGGTAAYRFIFAGNSTGFAVDHAYMLTHRSGAGPRVLKTTAGATFRAGRLANMDIYHTNAHAAVDDLDIGHDEHSLLVENSYIQNVNDGTQRKDWRLVTPRPLVSFLNAVHDYPRFRLPSIAARGNVPSPLDGDIVRDATDGKYYARRSGVWEPLQ